MTGFILIPVYTRYLLPEEYGILSILMIVFSAASIVYSLGMGAGLTRSYYDYRTPDRHRMVISTALYSSLVISGLLLCFSLIFSGRISLLIFRSSDYQNLLNLVFLMAFLEAFKTMCLTVFRTQKSSRKYSFFTLLFFATQLGLILFFVICLKLGVRGVILGGVISSGLSVFLLFPLKRDLSTTVSFSECKKMLAYSAPLVPDSLAAMVMTSADRFFLAHYSTLSEVGIYSLGYKFGMIISLLLIEPFRKIWDVMIFSVAQKKKDMQEYYSLLMTYFLLVASTLFLILNCPIKEIIQVIAGREFWPAYTIVPIISLAFVFLGINIIWGVGYLIKRKTKYVPIMTIISAGLNVILNYFLVPPFGMMGAAVATLISYFIWAVLRYLVSRQFYYIPYEWKRIGMIVLVAGAVFFIAQSISIGNLWVSLIIKLILGASLPLLLIPIKFYSRREREIIHEKSRMLLGADRTDEWY